VGLLKLNRGYINIFGAPTGSPESGVPGKNVGYMPQVNENFTPFINHMQNPTIE